MYPIPGSSKRIMNRMKALRALDNLLPTTIDGFNERQLIFVSFKDKQQPLGTYEFWSLKYKTV